MRIPLAAAALAACSLATSASGADGPVSLPQLAAGEVLLEVSGLGVVRTPATLAIVTGTAIGRGASEAEARRQLEVEVQRIMAAARAAGAAPGDIHVRTGSSVQIPEDLRVFNVAEPPPADEGAAEAPPPVFHAQSTVVVRLRNPAGAQELHNSIGGAESYVNRSPTYELTDAAPARRTARARAIAAARADAEAYAAALDMRIVRMLRVTERGGLDFLSMLATESEASARVSWGNPPHVRGPEVETYAVVGVDFVLAPR